MNIIRAGFCAGLLLLLPMPSVLAEVVMGPDNSMLAGATGIERIGDGWRFMISGPDPRFKPLALPRPIPAAAVAGIAVVMTCDRPVAGSELELYPVFDNARGACRDQRVAVGLRHGKARYLFPLRDVVWSNGQLTALRLDPGSGPGVISVESITVLDRLPEAASGDVTASIPVGILAKYGSQADRHPEAALMRYRLTADHLSFALVPRAEGGRPVVAIHRRNDAEWPLTASLSFASAVLRPFSPCIPPYVGISASAVRFIARGDSGGSRCAPVLVIHRAGLAPERVACPIEYDGRWKEIVVPLSPAGDLDHPLVNVSVEFSIEPGSELVVSLAEMEVVHPGGLHQLVSSAVPSLCDGLQQPLAERPVRDLPRRDTVAMGGYRLHEDAWYAGIPEMAAFIRDRFPEVDFVLAPVWPPPAKVAARLPSLPEGVYFQFQKARLTPDYLHARGLMPRNASGMMHPNLSNAVLATDPLIQSALRDEIDYAASLGVNSFKQVDYVWPFQGGRWGYDDASVVAYRQALMEEDEGLLLLPGPAGESGGLWRFWDYFSYYHGVRFRPVDLGLDAWSAYQPVSERAAANGDVVSKRNLAVYLALFHYEWLRQAQRFGRWAAARGGRHDFTLNPEDVGNGGDLMFITRLADAGYPYVEYFGGPSALVGAYHNLPSYIRAGEAAGKKMGLITEIGQTGNGQNYLDHEIGYLYAYELAAMGFRNYHNEWMSADWATMRNPENKYHHHRFQSWMSQAYGFRSARREGAVRPMARVLNVTLRSTVHYINSWIWGLNQSGSFGHFLADWHADFEQCDPMHLPAVIDRVDSIFFAPPVVRSRDGDVLAKWLGAGGKTLITHSSVPVSPDDGSANIAPGVDNVVYRGEEYSYSDFLIPSEGEHGLLPHLAGVRHEQDGWWSMPRGFAPLAEHAGHALLSVRRLPGGSRVLYVHRDPNSLDTDGRKMLMMALSKEMGMPVLADPACGSDIMVHRFRRPAGEVVHVWNRGFLKDKGFKAGYGDHLLPNRGPGAFDPERQPNPYKAPGVRCQARVVMQAPGRYRIYALLQGVERVVEVGEDCMLELSLDGVSADQFHCLPDGSGADGEMLALRRLRDELRPFCLHLSERTP